MLVIGIVLVNVVPKPPGPDLILAAAIKAEGRGVILCFTQIIPSNLSAKKPPQNPDNELRLKNRLRAAVPIPTASLPRHTRRKWVK